MSDLKIFVFTSLATTLTLLASKLSETKHKVYEGISSWVFSACVLFLVILTDLAYKVGI